MSATATATAETTAAAPAKGKKKKKLIIIVAAAVLVLAIGAVAAVMLLKKSSADGEEDGADGAEVAEAAEQSPAKAAVRAEPKNPPVFVPLDPFTVNLADREAERYAQIGITLEIDDAKTGDRIKQYMPAIRNNILMAIADRNAAELLGREGKARLAERVKRETARALGYQIPPEEAEAPAASEEDGKAKSKAKPKLNAGGKKKKSEPALPIRAVHFSNFIIQ